MNGPRNNLEEIKRRNNSSEISIIRSESSKPKSGFKFKLAPSEGTPSIYPPLIPPKPFKHDKITPSHSQNAISEAAVRSLENITNAISPSRKAIIPLKRSSPDANFASIKRARKEGPLTTTTRINLQESTVEYPKTTIPMTASQLKSSSYASPPHKPGGEATPKRSLLHGSKQTRLDQMSMDRLLKLKLSRQQKTIDHADLFLGRLKNKDVDDDQDIELIEAQYKLLKNSVKEVEEAISKRRAQEDFSVSSDISFSSNTPPPTGSDSNYSNVSQRQDFLVNKTVVSVEKTEITTIGVTPQAGSSSLASTSKPSTWNSRSVENNDDDSLWADMEELDHNEVQTQPPTPRRVKELDPLPSVNSDSLANPTRRNILSPISGDDSSHAEYETNPTYQEAKTLLRSVFQKEKFRPNQAKAIMSTLDGKDVFVLMPTGGGKSLCYQLPALCTSGVTKGVTVVISPLIALMEDQVNELRRLGIDVAVFNSDQSNEERRQTSGRLRGYGSKPAMLYLSPETLDAGTWMKEVLTSLYERSEIARFVLDEAHCLPGWGRGFRESYLALGELRTLYPRVPIMALTATATHNDVEDIITRLKMKKDCVRLQQSFNRPNLSYSVVPKTKGVNNDIGDWIKANYPRSTGVIYCLSTKNCEEVATYLENNHGLSTAFYHGQMDKEHKRRALTSWLNDEVRIMVATIAFGMGIDKADVRFVIHHSIPKNLAGYYQETGRAGRDGKPSDCRLYWTWKDVTRLENLIRKELKEKKIDQEEFDRQKTEIRKVAKYCVLDIDCRRENVLGHFHETFDRSECNKGCDNCVADRAGSLRDLTQEAIHISKLVQEFEHDKFNRTSLVAVFQGRQTSMVRQRGWNNSSFYGEGSHLDDSLVERLINRMITEGVLEEIGIANSNGFSHDYMKSGPAIQALFRGNKTFQIKVSDASSTHPSKSKKDVKGKKKVATVKSINRSEVEEITYFEDDDLGQPIDHYSRSRVEDSEDECLPSNSKSVLPSRTVTTYSTEIINIENKEAHAMSPSLSPFHKSLLKLRRSISREKKKDAAEVLTDECIETLVLLVPGDIVQFQKVLNDVYEDKHQVDKIMKRYGLRFLDLCVQECTRVQSISSSKPTSSVTEGAPKKGRGQGELRSKFAFVPPKASGGSQSKKR